MRTTIAALALLTGLLVSACDAANIPAGTQGPSTMSTGMDQPSDQGRPTSMPPTAGPRHSGRPKTTQLPTQPAAPSITRTYGGGTASPSSGATGIPTSYDEAAAHVAALPGPAQAKRRFSTSGDSVYCVLGDPVLGTACELRTGAIPDDVCDGSFGDAVGRIEMDADGAAPVCNTDTIREPGAVTAATGTLVGRGAVRCAVERIGVTCVDTDHHHGFFLTPGRYATFR